MARKNAAPAGRSLVFLKVSDLLFEASKPSRAFLGTVRASGVLEPLLVSPPAAKGARYAVRDGRRRATAAIEAGLAVVPAYVVEGTPEECEAWTIISNLHRSRNVAGELKALRALVKGGLDLDAIEAQLGLYKRDTKRLFGLLALVPSAEVLLSDGTLSPSTAQVLAGLSAAHQQQFLSEMGEGKPTLAAAKAFRLRVQYAPAQLSFLATPIPNVSVDLT